MAVGPTQPLKEMSKSKGTAIPVQVWAGPEVSRRLRLPDFKVVSLSSLGTGRVYAQEIFLVLIYFGARGGAVD